MRKVMITGSFDPVTVGHEDIIRRACLLFDEVRVTVFLNPEKQGMFSAEERVSLLRRVCEKFPRVSVDFDSGMVIDYARREGISLLVRALRDEKDLAYEMQMADFNRTHGGIETLFFAASPAFSGISSSEVRRRISAGESVSSLLPREICSEIEEIAKKRPLK